MTRRCDKCRSFRERETISLVVKIVRCCEMRWWKRSFSGESENAKQTEMGLRGLRGLRGLSSVVDVFRGISEVPGEVDVAKE